MTGQQLKNSILQMAVQGKLVPQDPNDEPASVLLERIRKEKEQLIKEEKIKKEKNPSYIFRGADNLPYEKVGKNEPVCILDEVPFDIPKSWEWARLGMISTYSHTKQKINAQNADPNMWGLDLEDIEKGGRLLERKTVGERKAVGDKTFFDGGDILYSKLRPYLLKIFVAPDCGICSPEIVPFKLFGKLDPEYIVTFLKCPYVDAVINAVTYGVKMPRVGTETMTELLVPIPPISEQKRIVEKLNEVTPLIENYAESYVRVTVLNRKFPELLKRSILQEAIQGKLVPQDPTDEPASVLLERIRAEKQKLIAEGKIKKDKHESVIFRRDNSHYEKRGSEEVCIDEELPFEIPETWQWVKLSDLVQFIGGYAYKSETFIEKSEYQVLRLGNVKNDEIKYSTKPVFISKELAEQTADFQCQTNDILITMTGTRLKRDYFYSVLISEKDANCFINQRVGCLRCYIPTLSRWLIWALKSEGILSQVFLHETGTANQGNLGAENIMKTFIPLPPLDEQIRICNMIECLSREVNIL